MPPIILKFGSRNRDGGMGTLPVWPALSLNNYETLLSLTAT
jgi:hypothetical protein